VCVLSEKTHGENNIFKNHVGNNIFKNHVENNFRKSFLKNPVENVYDILYTFSTGFFKNDK